MRDMCQKKSLTNDNSVNCTPLRALAMSCKVYWRKNASVPVTCWQSRIGRGKKHIMSLNTKWYCNVCPLSQKTLQDCHNLIELIEHSHVQWNDHKFIHFPKLRLAKQLRLLRLWRMRHLGNVILVYGHHQWTRIIGNIDLCPPLLKMATNTFMTRKIVGCPSNWYQYTLALKQIPLPAQHIPVPRPNQMNAPLLLIHLDTSASLDCSDQSW